MERIATAHDGQKFKVTLNEAVLATNQAQMHQGLVDKVGEATAEKLIEALRAEAAIRAPEPLSAGGMDVYYGITDDAVNDWSDDPEAVRRLAEIADRLDVNDLDLQSASCYIFLERLPVFFRDAEQEDFEAYLNLRAFTNSANLDGLLEEVCDYEREDV